MIKTEKVLAKKSLGQHFLKNEALIKNIVNLANIQEAEQVLEIGPGPGALTKLLFHKNCAKLLLLEKDNAFAQKHLDYIAENQWQNMQVINMDALDFDWKSLEGNWKIISNLPYNVGSVLIWDIVSQVPNLTLAVFMVQKEVAMRIRAECNSKTYGAISAWVQNFCSVKKGLSVSPSAFYPPPKVDSEVIVLTPIQKDCLPSYPENLAKTIKLCFQQRRKQLHKILQKNFPNTYTEEIWEKIGQTKSCRAENLSPKQFKLLSDILFKANN